VADRAEVIVDFSGAKKGDQIYLVNSMEQLDGSGPTFKTLDPGDSIVRFDAVLDDVPRP
jgi:hypothetical protein